jgi:2-methylcitrate dehydratase PrpD
MLDNLPATSTPARTLGEFACGLTFEHIPAAVLERAKLLILDALGCGIASNAYGFSDAALPAPPRSAGSAGAASSAAPTACRSATRRSSTAC